MATISRASIKKLVKKHFNVNITDNGADELARILEAEAKKIASFAVNSGKGKVTRKDIHDYMIKGKG